MSQEEVTNIGMPFYSTKSDGTGLGLMVCFKIIDSFHGKMQVTSELGTGTCFKIVLPLKEK
jgi:two-component system sporulation sensor kinase B